MHHMVVLGALAGLGVAALAAPHESPPAALGSALRPQDVKCETRMFPGSEGDTTWADGDVDQLAEPKRNNPKPKFPSAFKEPASTEYTTIQKEKVSGEVYLRFVVDTVGCVDMKTVTVVATTDSLFTEEVMRVLPKHRFEPARKGGQKVKAWRGWRFLFFREQGARLPF